MTRGHAIDPVPQARMDSGSACAPAVVCALLVLLVGGLASVGAQEEREPDAEACLACHAIEGFSGASDEPLFVDAEAFAKSTHGPFDCTSCHTDATEVPHAENLSAVGPNTCATCHDDVVATYRTSVHGITKPDGDRESAKCASCHGPPHEIRPTSDPASPAYPLNLPRTCGACHGNPELAHRHGIPVANAYELYVDSTHGRGLTRGGLLVAANCASCHGSHGIKPKEDPSSKIYRANIPSTCGACHVGVETDYREGIHGTAAAAGNAGAPVCIDCHTTHEIARVDTAEAKLGVLHRCGNCHEELLKTYRDTLHGQVTALGFVEVARCSDCHGSHRVFPASDPRSSVSPANLVTTCRQCHPQAGEKFVQFSPHADPDDRQKNPALYFTARMMELLIFGVFAFFGLHAVLWLSRSLVERRGGEHGAKRAEGKDEKE